MFGIAVTLERFHDDKLGLKWIEKAAQLGDPNALRDLANDYEWGEHGLEKNRTRSTQLYREAYDVYQEYAAAGNSVAIKQIGFFYEYGKGVVKDNSEALRYYLRSAELGNTSAMVFAANLIAKMGGSPAELDRAVGFLEKASQAGNWVATSFLAKALTVIYDDSRSYGLPPDERRARRLYLLGIEQRKAAGIHVNYSALDLAKMHDRGLGGPKDHRAAAQWLMTAIRTGAVDGLRLSIMTGDRSLESDYSRATFVELQRILRNEGYYRGELDGVIGPRSRAAIADASGGVCCDF